MSLLQSSLHAGYRGIRRAAVLDIKRLMHLPADRPTVSALPTASALPTVSALPTGAEVWDQATVPTPAANPLRGYSFSTLTAGELQTLLGSGTAPQSIGRPELLMDGRQNLVVAFQGRQLVAYVWLARSWVPAEENFSRSRHLGTSLQLPEGSVFAHTAYTSVEHRGRRLLGGLLSWARAGGVPTSEQMFATMDWTNEASRRAFVHLGFQQVGLIYRMGRGAVQFSLYPGAANRLGLQVAACGGGFRWAVG